MHTSPVSRSQQLYWPVVRIFVVVQVALGLILLIGAGLFLRTLPRAYAVDLGYRVDRILITTIEPGDRYQPAAGQAFYTEVPNRLNALPGVAAAGAARVTVLSGSSRTMAVSARAPQHQNSRTAVASARHSSGPSVSDRRLTGGR